VRIVARVTIPIPVVPAVVVVVVWVCHVSSPPQRIPRGPRADRPAASAC
jgi:hypothetical protein